MADSPSPRCNASIRTLARVRGSALCGKHGQAQTYGRTVQELTVIFNELPDALFCFDIAHARQVDSSMTEAFVILKHFGHRLRQVHISEVNTSSKHDRISRGAFRAFREIAHLIPQNIPAILETPVVESEIKDELTRAESSLRVEEVAVVWSPGQFAIQH